MSDRPVQDIAWLLTRHARNWREPAPGVLAIETWDGKWAAWKRRSDKTTAEKIADIEHPDDAVRVAREQQQSPPLIGERTPHVT